MKYIVLFVVILVDYWHSNPSYSSLQKWRKISDDINVHEYITDRKSSKKLFINKLCLYLLTYLLTNCLLCFVQTLIIIKIQKKNGHLWQYIESITKLLELVLMLITMITTWIIKDVIDVIHLNKSKYEWRGGKGFGIKVSKSLYFT